MGVGGLGQIMQCAEHVSPESSTGVPLLLGCDYYWCQAEMVLGLVSARKSDGQARPVAGSQDIRADARVGNAAGRGSPGADQGGRG